MKLLLSEAEVEELLNDRDELREALEDADKQNALLLSRIAKLQNKLDKKEAKKNA